MLKMQVQAFWSAFTDIFNTKDDDATGRVINLGCTLLAAFYNVFIRWTLEGKKENPDTMAEMLSRFLQNVL